MKINIIRPTVALTLLILISNSWLKAQVKMPEQGVWMTYYNGKNLMDDFQDMKNHGIDAVEVGIWGIEGNSRAPEILKAARSTQLKLIIGIPEVSEEAFSIPDSKAERAVMMGGAYNGKAIDRFRFSFTPVLHNITIESPVYDSTNCYGSIGRYFMGLTPVKAEVIIKESDFDGKQHLKIIDARIEPGKEHFWNMTFDLTGVKGDLNNVLLAVYWTSQGTRDYWIFGDAVSMFSEGFKAQLKKEVATAVNAWKDANGGLFPPEIIAVRYGDECFHLSGHLNSDACSFPVWDYSESAVNHFRESFNGEVPRGVGFTDMFGKEACARWMYNFHEAAAQSVKWVKECLKNEKVGHLPVFRNTTRMNVFDVLNDYDGSGQEMLAEAFDIIHLDPYPVNDKGYNQEIIPADMAYMEGLGRRLGKPVVPWMQAHVYGHRQHPTPEHISEMVNQQKQFEIHSIMWLGYGFEGSGNTFPVSNAPSWERAKDEHAGFKTFHPEGTKADFAAVRPYTARSVRGAGEFNADLFLTDYLLNAAVLKYNLKYDPFEPVDITILPPKELSAYPFIVAEAGIINEQNLLPLLDSKKPCLIITEGAEADPRVLHLLGIAKIHPANLSTDAANQNDVIILKPDVRYELNNDLKILYRNGTEPAIWKKDNLVVVGKLPDDDRMKIAEDLLKALME